ncbi:hypothetical protein [Ponticaulis koreensis]|uniref:hypothetical protein n=1 Tax=Ponticaulis koreensis TaxID=1123045 RepID=UPI0003B47127|nr:hypothetical protein [Ponticaulis koreensis]
MEIDWNLVVQIIIPLVAAFLGACAVHAFERKPKLQAWFLHAGAIQIKADSPFKVHTHVIVLKNAGTKSANCVRISHTTLPDFSVFPDSEYKIIDLPGGGKEIFLESLVPGQTLNISYLYDPPLTFDQIHNGIRFADGVATQIPIKAAPVVSKQLEVTAGVLMSVGFITLIYLGVLLFSHLMAL